MVLRRSIELMAEVKLDGQPGSFDVLGRPLCFNQVIVSVNRRSDRFQTHGYTLRAVLGHIERALL